MFKLIITPRFTDTDALGHINNTVLPVWFEQARDPLFRFFTPDLDPGKWELMIAKIEVEFLGELLYGKDVEIKTGLLNVGNSSMLISQEARQDGEARAKGKTVMVHYDFKSKRPVTIPESIRQELNEHLLLE